MSQIAPSQSASRQDLGDARTRKLYWTLVAVLVACSVGSVVGRIATVQTLINRKSMPFLSANDRSRWCTVRALGDHGTYAIDEVLEADDGNEWNTIDKVRHVGADGEFHYYSSKPTLLPTLMAGKYWVFKRVTGKSISDHPFLVIRTLLIFTNGLWLAIGLFLIARITLYFTDQIGPALFVVAAASFGTYLTPFAITFSNHLPATVCVIVVLALLVPLWKNDNRRAVAYWKFVAMGLFAGLAAAFELPALSLAAAVLVLCSFKSVSKVLLGYVPAFAAVAIAFFGTNYLAHDTWEPAYAHREDGKSIATVEGDFQQRLDDGILPQEIEESVKRELSLNPTVTPGFWPSAKESRWIVDFGKKSQLVVAEVCNEKFEVRQWKNWYEFPGSYWLSSNSKKSPVDVGEEDPWKYLLHITVGHHGVFSLTPILIIAILGLAWLAISGKQQFRLPALAFFAISIVVFDFYITRPQMDRNYGGWTSCFRWAIWMYPLWLVGLVPAVSAFWRFRILRWLLIVLLLLGAISASTAAGNPWSQPWLQEWFTWP